MLLYFYGNFAPLSTVSIFRILLEVLGGSKLKMILICTYSTEDEGKSIFSSASGNKLITVMRLKWYIKSHRSMVTLVVTRMVTCGNIWKHVLKKRSWPTSKVTHTNISQK